MFWKKKPQKYERWIVGWKPSWQEFVMAEQLNKFISKVENLPDEWQHDFICLVIAHFESMKNLSTFDNDEKDL